MAAAVQVRMHTHRQSVRPARDSSHVLIARLICSDPECAERVTAEAKTMRELETLSCECGCALEILGWPDHHEERHLAVVVRLPRRPQLPEAA